MVDLNVFGFRNLQFEDFNILEDDFRKLKALNSKFLYLVILNSKLLTS